MIAFKKNKVVTAYVLIIIVIFIWGISPPINSYLNQSYSVTLRGLIVSAIATVTLLLLSIKKLKRLNVKYLKVVPTGIFLSVATLLQKIGLLYTTPVKYAFLENLSCIVVPIILFFAIKKRPNVLTAISCVLCLVGTFILTGMSFSLENISFGIGEFLCALAGILFGFNIAYTGMYIKEFDTVLYLLVQHITSTVICVISLILLTSIKINGVPIEVVKFSWDIKGVIILVSLAIVSDLLCWILRTYSMKFVNPTAVSIIMPFSAVITGVSSVLYGMDELSFNLITGGTISLIAAIISGIADIKYENKPLNKSTTLQNDNGEPKIIISSGEVQKSEGKNIKG